MSKSDHPSRLLVVRYRAFRVFIMDWRSRIAHVGLLIKNACDWIRLRARGQCLHVAAELCNELASLEFQVKRRQRLGCNDDVTSAITHFSRHHSSASIVRSKQYDYFLLFLPFKNFLSVGAYYYTNFIINKWTNCINQLHNRRSTRSFVS